MKSAYAKIISCCLLTVLVMTTCTEADLTYRNQWDGLGYVRILPQWGDIQLPKGKDYYFYKEGDTGAPTPINASPQGYEGIVAAGEYKILAHNTDFSSVTFNDMQAYDIGRVVVESDNTYYRSGMTRAGESVVRQPGNVYTFAIATMTVTENDTITVRPEPKSMIRTLVLSFKLENVGDIESIHGLIYGIITSRYVANGIPTAAELAAAPNCCTPFDIEIDGNKGESRIAMLGICHPEYGEQYDSILRLRLTDNEGVEHNMDVDITKAVSDAIEAYHGDLPVEVEVKIEVIIKRLDSTLVGEVKPWEPGGGTGVVEKK